MEDYKYLIYIALSIIYFLFKNIGKKKKPVTRKNTSNNPQPHDSSNGKTFDDILAELSGRSPSNTPEQVNEENILEKAEERPLSRTVSDEDYENADDTLKELYRKGERLKSINELVDIEDVPTKSHFKAYEINDSKSNLAEEIREDFSNPESVKKAFIYSEIFNKKY